MAEANFDEFVTDPAHSGAGLVGRLINFTGAALSLALLVGVVVWGYRIAVRDATGVPVIQAMQGPMRVAPEDPGGVVAAHLGLAVNRVAGEGTAAPPAERVILAPRPIDLSDEDRPGLGVPVPQPVAAAPVLELPPVAVLPAPVPVDVPAARAEQPRALTPEDA
ncbi:MAG: SPOR domain-containing protein, partial [Gemmobacter sp.]